MAGTLAEKPLTSSEVEFLAEMQPIKIIPNFESGPLQFIGVGSGRCCGDSGMLPEKMFSTILLIFAVHRVPWAHLSLRGRWKFLYGSL